MTMDSSIQSVTETENDKIVKVTLDSKNDVYVPKDINNSDWVLVQNWLNQSPNNKIRKAPAPKEPIKVTHAAWLRLALIEINKLDAVETAVKTKGPVATALWNYATELSALDPEVIQIGAALRIDLNALFDRAESIRLERKVTKE